MLQVWVQIIIKIVGFKTNVQPFLHQILKHFSDYYDREHQLCQNSTSNMVQNAPKRDPSILGKFVYFFPGRSVNGCQGSQYTHYGWILYGSLIFYQAFSAYLCTQPRQIENQVCIATGMDRQNIETTALFKITKEFSSVQ